MSLIPLVQCELSLVIILPVFSFLKISRTPTSVDDRLVMRRGQLLRGSIAALTCHLLDQGNDFAGDGHLGRRRKEVQWAVDIGLVFGLLRVGDGTGEFGDRGCDGVNLRLSAVMIRTVTMPGADQAVF